MPQMRKVYPATIVSSSSYMYTKMCGNITWTEIAYVESVERKITGRDRRKRFDEFCHFV